MRNPIRVLDENADRSAAARWLRETVVAIGPGFHVDTPPSEYVDEAGKPSFSPADAECLARGLKIAASVLGPDVFEDLCLQGVWYALGVRYDAARGLLVPVGSPSSSA